LRSHFLAGGKKGEREGREGKGKGRKAWERNTLSQNKFLVMALLKTRKAKAGMVHSVADVRGVCR